MKTCPGFLLFDQLKCGRAFITLRAQNSRFLDKKWIEKVLCVKHNSDEVNKLLTWVRRVGRGGNMWTLLWVCQLVLERWESEKAMLVSVSMLWQTGIETVWNTYYEIINIQYFWQEEIWHFPRRKWMPVWNNPTLHTLNMSYMPVKGVVMICWRYSNALLLYPIVI